MSAVHEAVSLCLPTHTPTGFYLPNQPAESLAYPASKRTVFLAQSFFFYSFSFYFPFFFWPHYQNIPRPSYDPATFHLVGCMKRENQVSINLVDLADSFAVVGCLGLLENGPRPLPLAAENP